MVVVSLYKPLDSPTAGRVHHYIFTSFTSLIDSGSSPVSLTGYEACGRAQKHEFGFI
jgi:hypothetical protein